MIKPIKFWSFGGYRRFCSAWWRDLFRSCTIGLIYDIKTYWHRARYGWAPRDTWSLDHYLATYWLGPCSSWLTITVAPRQVIHSDIQLILIRPLTSISGRPTYVSGHRPLKTLPEMTTGSFTARTTALGTRTKGRGASDCTTPCARWSPGSKLCGIRRGGPVATAPDCKSGTPHGGSNPSRATNLR